MIMTHLYSRNVWAGGRATKMTQQWTRHLTTSVLILITSVLILTTSVLILITSVRTPNPVF